MARIYIAGPMTGIPGYNFPAFNRAADLLRERGWEVVNPAELDGPDFDPSKPVPRETYRAYLKRDIHHLTECDAIIMLHGWSDSTGACFERQVALMCGIRVYYENQKPWPPSST